MEFILYTVRMCNCLSV